MAFAARISSHTVYGKLSYPIIADLVAKAKDGKHLIGDRRQKQYYLHADRKYNPNTGEYETAMCYRMYATDILQFFEDGTCHIITYPSAITYSEINRYGPLRCYTDTRCKYKEQRRFGYYSGTNYPIPDGAITVRADGTIVEPLVDKYETINPEMRKERRELAKKFRAAALPRMLLGEFGDVWAGKREFSRRIGWGRTVEDGTPCAMVPNDPWLSRRFAEMLLNGETHDDMHKIGDHLKEGPVAKDAHDATIKACGYLLQSLLDAREDKEYEYMTYEGVKA